jgi:hypothetical protein
MPNNSGMEIVLLVEVVILVVVALFAIRYLWVSKDRDAAEGVHDTPPAASSFQRYGGGYATEDTVPSMRTRPADWDAQ